MTTTKAATTTKSNSNSNKYSNGNSNNNNSGQHKTVQRQAARAGTTNPDCICGRLVGKQQHQPQQQKTHSNSNQNQETSHGACMFGMNTCTNYGVQAEHGCTRRVSVSVAMAPLTQFLAFHYTLALLGCWLFGRSVTWFACYVGGALVVSSVGGQSTCQRLCWKVGCLCWHECLAAAGKAMWAISSSVNKCDCCLSVGGGGSLYEH